MNHYMTKNKKSLLNNIFNILQHMQSTPLQHKLLQLCIFVLFQVFNKYESQDDANPNPVHNKNISVIGYKNE